MPLVPSPALVQEQRDAWQFPAFGIFFGTLYNHKASQGFFCKESKKYVVHEITSGL